MIEYIIELSQSLCGEAGPDRPTPEPYSLMVADTHSQWSPWQLVTYMPRGLRAKWQLWVENAGLWHQNDFISNPAVPHSEFITFSLLILIYLRTSLTSTLCQAG